MRLSNFKKVVFCTALLGFVIPDTAFSQTFSGLFKVLQQVTSSDPIGAIKSLTETLQGQVAPGTYAENAEGKVVLYRTSWCAYCKRAAAYMQAKNIPFVERDIEANASYKSEYKKLGGTGGVPFIVFGQKTVQGFSETAFDKNYADFQATLAASPTAENGQSPDLQKGNSDGMRAGQTLVGKIPGVKVYTQPNKAGERLAVLSKTDEIVYMGEERYGLYRVTTQKGEGWVDKLLVKFR